MDIPVYFTLCILEELMDSYTPRFNDKMQFKHFQEFVSAFKASDKMSISHLTSIINYSSQSSMNRSCHMESIAV